MHRLKLGLGQHPAAKRFLLSASQELNIIQPQFYFPGFDVISDDGVIYTPESILDSKYQVITIDYQIDKNIDKCLNNCDHSSSNNSECEEEDCGINAEAEELLAQDAPTECPIKELPIAIGQLDIHEGDEPKTTNKPVNVIENDNLEEQLLLDNICKPNQKKQKNSISELVYLEKESVIKNLDNPDNQDDGEWTDCSSENTESVISEYDLLANTTLDIPDEECNAEKINNIRDVAEQAKFFEQVRNIDKNDNTDNCFSLMATLQKTYNGLVQTYHQKIFCKKAPLIEPLKAIDPNIYPELFTSAKGGILNNILLPDPNTKQVFDKLNSIHNTSHVETLALYTLSKLTELGRCPTFPYYLGSIQGIMPVHYHNITEEIQDYSEMDWFNELLEDGKIEVLYIDISEYVNSGREILRSEDINININVKGMPTDAGQFTDGISELTVEFETLMDDTDVTDFITTGKLDTTGLYKPKLDFSKSQPSTATIQFEDLDAIDIDTLKPDDILPAQKFDNKLFYLKLENFPVALSFMEKMSGSLYDLMNSPKPMDELELLAVLFQIAFGLSVANKEFKFVHNDLHAGNIMFQSTPQKNLYYLIHGNYYRIPTFNKIAKIIDFARATIFINDKWIVSDAFEPGNDAGKQYAMPDANGKYISELIAINEQGNKLPRPNPSFDLALLATILVQYVTNNMPASVELNQMLNHWATDKHGINHVHADVDFSLYTNIARDCHNAIPKEVLKHKLFQKFKVSRKQIPKKQYIYKF